MKDEIKWKYSDENLNLQNSSNKTDEQKKSLDFIDKIKKDELRNVFDTAIQIKYEKYKKYLFEYNLFLFAELENNIKESVYCLIIGIHTASITNTNLILERAIKLALIQYQTENLLDYNDKEVIEKYILSDKKHSGKNIDENIQTCQRFKILNVEEAKELKAYKLKFRDGFSHFTPKNILKDENSLIHTQENTEQNSDKYLMTPTYQALAVRQFARNNAEEHLKYVLKIINHLQYKVLEKFREKK